MGLRERTARGGEDAAAAAPSKPRETSNKSNAPSVLEKMLKRTLVAFVGLFVCLYLIFTYEHMAWCIMISAIQLFVFRELVNLRYVFVWERVAVVLIMIFFFFPGSTSLSPCLSIFYLGLSVSVSFPVSVFSSSTDSTDGKAART